jgi:hypothetical protein
MTQRASPQDAAPIEGRLSGGTPPFDFAGFIERIGEASSKTRDEAGKAQHSHG